MQEMVANEVNDRMGRAVGELKDKYEKGGKGYDAASDAQVRYDTARSKRRFSFYLCCDFCRCLLFVFLELLRADGQR